MAIIGTTGNDDLLGTPNADTMEGLGGNDFISGGGGDDLLFGGDGDDFLQGGLGNDTIDGGANGPFVDTVDYAGAATGVDVNLATGAATDGEGGTDVLIGIEAVNGTDHADTLTGDAGMNWFRPYGGDDVVDGGAGRDVVFYESASSGVVVNLQLGFASGIGIGTDVLTSIEAAHGSPYDDEVTLANVGGYVFGRAGNDVLFGGSGHDNFFGGSGNDTIEGGAGWDNLSYTDDTYDHGVLPPTGLGVIVNLTTGTAVDNWGNTDTFTGIEGVQGSKFDDTLTGNEHDNFLNGDDGADVLSGLDGNDNLRGGLGDDVLDGGAGDFDTADYFDASAGVVVDLDSGSSAGAAGVDSLVSIENINGSEFADVLTGNAGRNNLNGYGGNDTLIGGGGDDFLQGGDGSDLIDGGAGMGDMAGYFDSSASVVVDLSTHTYAGGAAGDVLVNIENIGGSSFNDTLTGDALSNYVDGGEGDDTISGLAGNDNLQGGLGNDTLNGGGGVDGVSYFNATGIVNVNLAAGMATGADGIDTLISIENISGSAFNDTLTGDALSNFIDGGHGDDVLDGGSGTDTAGYFGASAAVFANLAMGSATGGAGSDTLLNIESLSGSSFGDTLTGNAGNNSLRGEAGNDTLIGNAGNDFITGGSGNDAIDGGAGAGDTADYFFSDTSSAVVVDLSTGFVTGGAGNDTLTGIENVNGSNFGDTITGDANVNFIDGRGGNDTLFGGAGRDNFVGGAGDDSIDGGAITDRTNYSDLNSISYASSTSAVVINLFTGSVQDGLGGTDNLANINFVTGSGYADTFLGSSDLNLFEQFEGGQGNDIIDGGAIDTVLQRNSNRATYASANGSVTVDLDLGTATGAAGNDTLININHATGGSFADVLLGSASSITEQFEGRGGNDLIDGRGGIDIVRYDSSAMPVVVNLVTGEAQDGLGGVDTLLNVEGIRGSSFDDILTGGNAANGTGATDGFEVFTGNAGNDIIDGGGGYDRADYVTSTTGVEVTLGGSGPGIASDGLGGTDTLISIEGVRGSVFDDVLTGSDSAAFELFEGSAGNDIIDGRGGIDRADYRFAGSGVVVDLKAGTALDGYGGSDSLANVENVRGSSFDDLITGDRGSNRIEGGAGNDVIDGGAGFDVAVFSGAQAGYTIVRHGITVTVTGADGIDSLRSVETLSFSDGDLVLWGPGAQGNGNGGGVGLVGVPEA